MCLALKRGLLLFVSGRKCEDGIAGGGVAHEEKGVGGGSALFVEGVTRPEALRFVLMSGEPGEAFFQMHVGIGDAGLFGGKAHEPRGVTIAFCFERSVIAALPRADESGHAPSAVGLLMGGEAIDYGAL